MVADGALNFSSLPPGTTTLAGVQSLVEVLSEVQTGGSASVQHDLVHLVVEQLWVTPLMVLVVLVGAPHDSAPHCFCSAFTATGIVKNSAQSKNLVATIIASVYVVTVASESY
jgi:hypothetical protein